MIFFTFISFTTMGNSSEKKSYKLKEEKSLIITVPKSIRKNKERLFLAYSKFM